jgi:hypothetical protein
MTPVLHEDQKATEAGVSPYEVLTLREVAGMAENPAATGSPLRNPLP